MTRREELDREPIEPDPTGMRELLASLPDPGPMPAALEARILGRLAEIRAEDLRADADRSTDRPTGLPHPPSRDHDADIVPLSAYGKDRPDRHRWFAAAAGIAAAAVVGIVVTDGLTGEGWVSSVINRGGSDAGGASSAQAADSSDQQQDLRVAGSGTDYRADTLATQARELLARRDQAMTESTSQPEACLAALGIAATDLPVLDVASYEGRPAYVVVWTREGTSSVVVTETSCGEGGAQVITGPMPVG